MRILKPVALLVAFAATLSSFTVSADKSGKHHKKRSLFHLCN